MADRSGDEPRPGPGQRPWVHPSELPAGLDERPERRIGRPLSLGVVGAVAVVGIGALVAGPLTSSTASPPSSARLTASPTIFGGVATAGSADAYSGVVIHVAAWSGSQVHYASGLVVDADEGLVVTSANVVENSGTIEIHVAPGSTYAAELVGYDPVNGLAVLRAPDAVLRAPTFNESHPGRLEHGDACFVVGAGRRGEPWARSGRVTETGMAVRHAGGWMIDAIGIDVPLTPNPAGSAVVDGSGDLIGLVSMLDGEAPLVVPAAEARRSVAAISREGAAVRAWLGVKARDHAAVDGAVVEAVRARSPASDAGIQAGDVIVGVGATHVGDAVALVRAVREHSPGETVTVSFIRSGETIEVSVRLASGS